MAVLAKDGLWIRYKKRLGTLRVRFLNSAGNIGFNFHLSTQSFVRIVSV